MGLELVEAGDLGFEFGDVLDICEGELAGVVVPPNPVRILAAYIQTISQYFNGSLELKTETKGCVGRSAKLFGFSNPPGLTPLSEHRLQSGVEIIAWSYGDAMQEADLEIGIPR